MKSMLIFALLLVLLFIGIFSPPEENGYVTLWFDDGLLSTYQTAYPLLKEKGWKGVLAVVADQQVAQQKFEPDGDPVMSWKQVEELYNAGWELSVHSMEHRHLNSIMDETILANEIVTAKAILEEKGFFTKSFTFPYGENGLITGQKMISENYSYWRSSTEEINPIPSWRHVTSQFLVLGIEEQTIKDWITEAEQQKKWLVISVHAIVENPQNFWQSTPEEFLMLLELLEQSELEVVLPHEIFSKYGYAEEVTK